MGFSKVCNNPHHPQNPTTIHNHPQPSTTTHNHSQLTKNYSKNQDLSQTVMLLHFRCSYWNRRWVLIVIRNSGIYSCVWCLCEYTLQVITLTIFWLGWLFVSVSIKSNSFEIKSNDFCLLKIWIYELLLINIK